MKQRNGVERETLKRREVTGKETAATTAMAALERSSGGGIGVSDVAIERESFMGLEIR